MQANKEQDPNITPAKKTYTYNDIIKMQSTSPYTTIGEVIPSHMVTAPRAIFGTADKTTQAKMLAEERFMKTITGGKEGVGPAAYLPSRYTNQQGKQILRPDIQSHLKYSSTPNFSIGKGPRKGQELPIYNYMATKNDNLQLNLADLKRRNSTPTIRIGTDPRFKDERRDKIMPGPTYDPKLRADAPQAPRYTMGSRRSIAGTDPFVPNTGTSNQVGPNTYFQKVKKSNSTSSINRIPLNSQIRHQPIVSFTKGPKTLTAYRNSVDETYDIKTKTILAHYDFQYDAGKGLNSGRAWEKKNIVKCSQNPPQRNKMKSFTMARSSRQKEEKRGKFASMMSQAPMSVRLDHPKF